MKYDFPNTASAIALILSVIALLQTCQSTHHTNELEDAKVRADYLSYANELVPKYGALGMQYEIVDKLCKQISITNHQGITIARLTAIYFSGATKSIVNTLTNYYEEDRKGPTKPATHYLDRMPFLKHAETMYPTLESMNSNLIHEMNSILNYQRTNVAVVKNAEGAITNAQQAGPAYPPQGVGSADP